MSGGWLVGRAAVGRSVGQAGGRAAGMRVVGPVGGKSVGRSDGRSGDKALGRSVERAIGRVVGWTVAVGRSDGRTDGWAGAPFDGWALVDVALPRKSQFRRRPYVGCGCRTSPDAFGGSQVSCLCLVVGYSVFRQGVTSPRRRPVEESMPVSCCWNVAAARLRS